MLHFRGVLSRSLMIASTRVTLLLSRENNFPFLGLCAACSLGCGYQFALSHVNFYSFLSVAFIDLLYPASLIRFNLRPPFVSWNTLCRTKKNAIKSMIDNIFFFIFFDCLFFVNRNIKKYRLCAKQTFNRVNLFNSKDSWNLLLKLIK